MRYRSNHILAYVPEGEEGVHIIKQASFFQQSLGMKVFLYRIIEKPSIFQRIFRPKRAKNEQNQALNDLREFADKVVDRDYHKHFTYRIHAGNKLRVLLRQAKKGGYEFIIIGKDGENKGLNNDELDKLISRSVIPIMTVSMKHLVDSVNNIIIPVDVLQTTQKKLLWATYFAKKYKAKITLVSAISLNINLKQSLAWRNAEKLKHMLKQRGINCEVEIIKEKEREKHEVINEFIEKTGADLVIIRTHQDSFAKDVQIGNFVSNVVHGSKIPVFTVNRFLQPMPVDFEI